MSFRLGEVNDLKDAFWNLVCDFYSDFLLARPIRDLYSTEWTACGTYVCFLGTCPLPLAFDSHTPVPMCFCTCTWLPSAEFNWVLGWNGLLAARFPWRRGRAVQGRTSAGSVRKRDTVQLCLTYLRSQKLAGHLMTFYQTRLGRNWACMLCLVRISQILLGQEDNMNSHRVGFKSSLCKHICTEMKHRGTQLHST